LELFATYSVESKITVSEVSFSVLMERISASAGISIATDSVSL